MGRKKKEDSIVKIKINKERFNEERDRVRRYLDGISNRKVGTYEAISILEDLGVILDTYELPKDIVLQQLEDELKTR